MERLPVSFQNGRLLVDGKPVFLLSGELHYYRQPRENWQHLIDEAKAMGLNCIASYVPWLLHEEQEGKFCFEDNLDLGAFIDLCGENGLYFFVRPGPFIMAEMKNEGLPYWVAKKYPDAVPVGFHGERRPSTTLDYNHPGYLSACKKWVDRVMGEIVPRLWVNGGPVIGVQLDNEIGMLNWVTNNPLLNDNTLLRFRDYLKESYTGKALSERYPFSLADDREMMDGFRSPAEGYSHAFHLDYGRFMRRYYAEYLRILRGYAEDCGVRGVPFFVNVHGTGDGRLYDFPLGLSQLYEGWNQGGGMISGSDLYLGEPKEGNYQDLYVGNALTACMNKKGNPLTSIEFECSDGPYCSLNGMRFHPAAIAHSVLMTVSQNARMISFYVFSGGENYLLKHPEGDGDDRMAFTGELHGLNAPVQPDGSRNFSFAYTAKAARAIHALNGWIADAEQATDPVVMAFVPDLFLTETCCPDSETEKAIQKNLKKWRCAGASIDSVARSLLDAHVSFTAADIQNDPIPEGKALFFCSPRYLPAAMQQKLADFVTGGGRLILFGEVPQFDLEGAPCTILADALKLSAPTYLTNNGPKYFLTVSTGGSFEGAAADNRAEMAQCFPKSEMPDGILFPHGTALCCGFIREAGKGKAAVIGCDYPADPAFYSRLFDEMGIAASVSAPFWRQGVYFTRMRGRDGGQLLCLINLDYVDKTIPVAVEGKTLFERFTLRDKAGVLLPYDFSLCGALIRRSTAEIVGYTENSITFRPTQLKGDSVLLSGRQPLAGEGYTVTAEENGWLVRFDREVTVELGRF